MTYQRRPVSTAGSAVGAAAEGRSGSGSGAGADLGLGLRDGAGAAQQALGLVDRDLLLRLRGAEERARGKGRLLVGELRGVDAAVLLRCGFLGRGLIARGLVRYAPRTSSCSLRSFSSMRLLITAAAGGAVGPPTMPLVMVIVKRLSKRKM